MALKYDKSKDIAPKVVAKGAGFIAEQILTVAQKNAVPVYQNKTLTNVLMAVEIDREVPPELYNAVAEVLAHIYRLDQVLGKRIK
ncbi:EscU/YscU/HrcU family type III secretion system export apparatus switch protein [Acetonema longum]|uniref:EscU/YscU/HrcU family type III secretion system export apparatus switch protein n=1 Tax=Acetonema longum TaxID=2374 RepID=UPI0006809283|nr:EscU/YscU/HrcU family type III secretion system export apparatus switch protein [Acetonema longum]